MKRLLPILLIVFVLCSCGNNNNPSNEVEYTKLQDNLDIHCYNSATLNPIFAENNANAQLSWICFEPLLKTSNDGSITTALARGYFISENGLEWTVPLENEVKWHDGTLFTAKDVVATCNEILKNENCIYYYNLSNVKKVVAVDDATVKFVLNAPQSGFANLLEFPIVKQEYVNKTDDFLMIGTGPFKYEKTENKNIIFKANNEWWGNKKPYIKTVTAKILPDKDTAIYSFNAKVIDVISSSIKDWSKYPSEAKNVAEYSTGDFFYLKLNMNTPALGNFYIRCAVAQAIDKEAIKDMAMLSYGVVTDTVINPMWKFHNKDSYKLSFNPAQAKQLVLDNGEEEINLRIIVNEESEIKTKTATQIKSNLISVGINAEVSVLGFDDYKEAYYSGDYDLAVCEINYSPEMISKAVIGNSDEANNLFNQLQNCSIDEDKKEIFIKLQDLTCKNMEIIPLFFDTGMLLFNDNVLSGLSPTRNNIYNDIHLWKLK
ncbi:MAG: ABC transporter substrate-binding protein [Clostridia bacterium]|nr:ABC transporter substrate-binding protein [Clostridia bacterium]